MLMWLQCVNKANSVIRERETEVGGLLCELLSVSCCQQSDMKQELPSWKQSYVNKPDSGQQRGDYSQNVWQGKLENLCRNQVL